MAKGKTVKSEQTGFDIELPAKQVAQVEVVSTFGDNEANEGSIAKMVDGDISALNADTLFITEAGD